MSLRVLVLSDYRDSLNAVRPEGSLFIELVRQFDYRVTLMTPREGAAYLAELEAGGVNIIDWHPTKKFSSEESDFLRAELDRGNYDILHLHNNKAVATGVRAARGWKGKVVAYRGFTGNVHWYDPTAYLTYLHPRIDLITCVSPAVKEHLDKQRFFDPAKTVVVSKGHDPEWYVAVKPMDVHAAFDIPRDKLTVLLIANAQKAKGLTYLGNAIRRLPAELPIHFLFAGRGLEATELPVDLADSPYHDAEDFTFLGHRNDALSILAAVDINILPSIKEGLNKVLLEGFFLGRATIMTDIPGNRGLGIDGETALIVPPKSEDALVGALVRLVEDTALRERIGTGGAAYIRTRYRAEDSARALDAAYRNLLSR